MSIGIVTVTYGNRFHYLEQLISYVQKNDQVHKAVIVTNGIEQTVLNQINSAVAGSEKFIVFSFENNEGSAAGFKKGIEIMRQESDYIWLLDDDNLPEPEALSSLTTHWKVLKMRDNKDALLSYRPDRSFYRSVQQKNPRGMIGMDNSFMGFHVLDKISKLFKQKSIDPNISYGPVIVATFGGCFFIKTYYSQ